MNIVLAGECGTGKSSLINLIVGRDVAKTSNDTMACTTEVRSYKASIDGCNLKLWDTPGLDKGSTTRANARSSEALVKLLHQLKNHGEIHLLIYCMHGNRAKAALLKYYETIRDFLPPQVPIVAIVTRLERYQNCMEDWWSNNVQELASHGMNFADHACITTVPGCHRLSSAFRERLIYSQRTIRDLIRRNRPSQLPLVPLVRFPATQIPNPTIRGQRVRVASYVVREQRNTQKRVPDHEGFRRR